MTVAPRGPVKPGWEEVADAFAANFAAVGEVGAYFVVYHRGRAVAELWGGLCDVQAGALWQATALATYFSCTKGVIATLARRLIDCGALDPDKPVRALLAPSSRPTGTRRPRLRIRHQPHAARQR